MRRGRPALALLALLASCAGGPRPPWEGKTICAGERSWDSASSGDVWIATLLRGWDARTRRATSPALDCTGAQVIWDGPGLACDDGTLARTHLPDRPLGDEDLIVTEVVPGISLAWVVTGRFASGEGFGPVALVEVSKRHVTVRLQGVLRAFPRKARLRLEKMAGTDVLVAEGERCGAADAACERAARLLLLSGDRFEPIRFVDGEGRCLAPGFVFLRREESQHLDSGWRRSRELTASLVFGPAGLTVQEQFVIRDVDPRNPTAAGRIFRRADDEWTVRPDRGRFLGSGASLWVRMRGEGQK